MGFADVIYYIGIICGIIACISLRKTRKREELRAARMGLLLEQTKKENLERQQTQANKNPYGRD